MTWGADLRRGRSLKSHQGLLSACVKVGYWLIQIMNALLPVRNHRPDVAISTYFNTSMLCGSALVHLRLLQTNNNKSRADMRLTNVPPQPRGWAHLILKAALPRGP
jgi:hypothetical protein